MNLRGETELVLDTKGRMAIPATYRQGLADSCASKMVVAKHPLDPCLLLYPLPAWLDIEEKFGSLSSFDDPLVRKMERNFIGKSESVSLDKSGRILLPQKFRLQMGLDKSIVLVGIGKKFEIWREDIWAQQDMEWSDEMIKEMPEALKGVVL